MRLKSRASWKERLRLTHWPLSPHSSRTASLKATMAAAVWGYVSAASDPRGNSAWTRRKSSPMRPRNVERGISARCPRHFN